MSDLTAEEVAAIRGRAEAATPGPWFAVASGVEGAGTVFHDAHVLHYDAAHIAGLDPQTVLALCDLAERAARAEATIERARALAERWRYKGEHGWGPWQEGYGPSPEDDVLDHAAADLRRVLDNKGEERR